MKTLLIYPPYSYFSQGYAKWNIANLPMGLACLGAYLKRSGHDVSILDLNIKMYCDVKDKGLWHENMGSTWGERRVFTAKILPKVGGLIEKWTDVTLKSKPGIVGFYISSCSWLMALCLARRLKQKDNGIVIIFGGPDCYPERAREFLNAGFVDSVIMGEGEITLSEIIDSYKKTSRISPCPGAFFIKNSEIIYGGERSLIENLDTLPYPDFSDLVDEHKMIFGDSTWLGISWLRGCTNSCVFCYESRLWKRCRARSAQSIVEEFIYQKNRYGLKAFSKGDSTLSASEAQINQVCDLLIENKADVLWRSQARPEGYLSQALLQKMHQAGCRSICYGVESGSQAVIDRLKKNIDINKVQEILINTSGAGIDPCVSIMTGTPEESLLDFAKTVRFFLKNRRLIYRDSLGVSPAAITPMSDWYLNAGKYGMKFRKDKTLFWRSKNYLNNYYRRIIEKYILKLIAYIFFKR